MLLKKNLFLARNSGHVQKLVFMCCEYFRGFAMSFYLYFENSLQKPLFLCMQLEGQLHAFFTFTIFSPKVVTRSLDLAVFICSSKCKLNSPCGLLLTFDSLKSSKVWSQIRDLMERIYLQLRT